VKLLLDTHIALWAIAQRARLAEQAAALIADSDNRVHVSAVTLWEIAIKHALRRGAADDMPISATEAKGYFEAAGFELLAVTPEEAAGVDRLPGLHGDPFDRLLVAQALHEPLRLVTHDRRVAAYSPNFILV
jgi:PIN domain nuclease of toxin-antitoxin system